MFLTVRYTGLNLLYEKYEYFWTDEARGAYKKSNDGTYFIADEKSFP